MNNYNYNNVTAPPRLSSTTITKQSIEKKNPIGVSKYKDCSNMNIDIITDPKELHNRYQS